MVATKPHYFLDLDIQRTVENFLDNVPEFWSFEEFAESVKDDDIFFIDRSFFVHYFIALMHKQEFRDVWDVGRQLLRLLRDEEARETQENINEIVSKMFAIPNNPNSLSPIFKNKYKMKTTKVIKYLGLLSWLLYYRLSKECLTPETWESVFTNNQIGFCNSNKHASSDEDGPSEEDCSVRVKSGRKRKARKKKTYDRNDDGDDELLDYDASNQKLGFLSNTRSWLLSTDGYSSAWSIVSSISLNKLLG
ncbi:hypothetical protein JHK87_044491 [Glycine soja]|nr:hypothetical protein JHK87_044491 [Glycine soja]